MNKHKLLAISILLFGLSGIQNSQASNIISNRFNNNITYELNDIENDIENDIIEKRKLNNNTDSTIFINKILDRGIQEQIFLYLKKEISLTKLKKDLNNNLQKRKKIHKNLVYEYNKNLQSEKYLELITNNGLKIDKIYKLRNIFLYKNLL